MLDALKSNTMLISFLQRMSGERLGKS